MAVSGLADLTAHSWWGSQGSRLHSCGHEFIFSHLPVLGAKLWVYWCLLCAERQLLEVYSVEHLSGCMMVQGFGDSHLHGVKVAIPHLLSYTGCPERQASLLSAASAAWQLIIQGQIPGNVAQHFKSRPDSWQWCTLFEALLDGKQPGRLPVEVKDLVLPSTAQEKLSFMGRANGESADGAFFVLILGRNLHKAGHRF